MEVSNAASHGESAVNVGLAHAVPRHIAAELLDPEQPTDTGSMQVTSYRRSGCERYLTTLTFCRSPAGALTGVWVASRFKFILVLLVT